MDHTSESPLFCLPEALVVVILSKLSLRELLRLCATCKRCMLVSTPHSSPYALIKHPEHTLWQRLIKQYGISDLQGWHYSTYRELYIKLLGKYGHLLGRWTAHVTPYGTLLKVHLQPPNIIGSAVAVHQMNGPPRTAPMFAIEHHDGGRIRIACNRTTASSHNAYIVSAEDGKSFEFSCQLNCQHSTCEVGWRLTPTAIPQPPSSLGPEDSNGVGISGKYKFTPALKTLNHNSVCILPNSYLL